jgi:hypothetical protein
MATLNSFGFFIPLESPSQTAISSTGAEIKILAQMVVEMWGKKVDAGGERWQEVGGTGTGNTFGSKLRGVTVLNLC